MLRPEQELPLAMVFPSPEPAAVDDSRHDAESQWKLPFYDNYLNRRRCALCCCGCLSVGILLLGLAILVLALVFKIRDPTLEMNSLRISNVYASSVIDVELVADLSINNPNEAQFTFNNSTSVFFHEGEKIGEGYFRGGKIGNNREVRRNVTVRIETTQSVMDTLRGQRIELKGYTEIGGRVNVLGIYKKSKTIMLNCTLWPNNGLVVQELNKTCISTTR